VRSLIAYDGSATAATAVRAAAALFPGAQAVVATVSEGAGASVATTGLTVPAVSPELIQSTLDAIEADARQAAEGTAQEGAERAREHGLEAEARATEWRGSTWSAMLELARELDADVVVCGTRGRGAFTRALLGSTASGLLHNAELPLLIVHDGAGALDGPAVLAYDGSEPSDRAVAAAGPLLAGRPTVVLHVWESQYRRGLTARALGRGPVDEVRAIVKALEQSLEEKAQAVTAHGVELARAAGLDATGVALESDAGVWRAVASAARERQAAVIVCGARGLGGARSALLGSASSGLIHNAEAPILVVPPPDRD
jgi:nucleotide-binding universal stress UspA family protein